MRFLKLLGSFSPFDVSKFKRSLTLRRELIFMCKIIILFKHCQKISNVVKTRQNKTQIAHPNCSLKMFVDYVLGNLISWNFKGLQLSTNLMFMKQFWLCKPNIISMNSFHWHNNQHSYMITPIKSSHKYMNLFQNFNQCWVSYASKYASTKGFVLQCYHRWYKCLLKLDIKRIWNNMCLVYIGHIWNYYGEWSHVGIKYLTTCQLNIFLPMFFLWVNFCNFANFF